jgi:hypothetical protein
MAYKIQDVQSVQIKIPNTKQSATKTVTHGLYNGSTKLTPDMIEVEITDFTKDPAAAPLYGVISKITRSTPEDGTFTIEGYLDAANDKATDAVLTCRVTSVYWSGWLGKDHTV